MQSCLLRGLPQLRLLGIGGKALPTKVVPDPRYTPKPFVLRPGHATTAKARFSPDVPGPGEPVAGRHCEPVAHTARVTVGGTSVVVALHAPTSVCEHGLLTFTPYR